MLLKPRVSYTKALVVALLACWATAEATRDGVIGSVLALGSLNTNATHKAIPVKRNLKAIMAMTTSDPTSTIEERTLPESLATALKKSLGMIGEETHAELMRLYKKSNGEFLGNGDPVSPKGNLLASLDRAKFTAFASDAESRKAFRLLHGILFEHYEHDDVAVIDAVYAAHRLHGDLIFTGKMITAQAEGWIINKETLQSVFARLKLDRIATAHLFRSRQIISWFRFASFVRGYTWEMMLAILLDTHSLSDLIKVLVEVPHTVYAEELLHALFSIWRARQPAKNVEKFLTNMKPEDRSDNSPFVQLYKKYISTLHAEPRTASPFRNWSKNWDNSVQLPPQKKQRTSNR